MNKSQYQKQMGYKMQKIFIESVEQGSIIAKDIINDDGRILLSKGTVFKDNLIKRLENAGISEVFIEDPKKLVGLHIDDVIFEKTRSQARSQVKKTMVKFNTMCHINIDKINAIVDDIMNQLLSKKDIVLTLSQIRSIDDYTYEHSVNVCVLSLIVGIDLNLEKDMLKKLGVGALLHDIGKVGVSESILKKPSKLTCEEFDEIKKHTQYGYDILSKTDVSEESALIALYHHEKFDGSGYNTGLKGGNIPLFSRIVAIADVYDAISNNRVYRNAMKPNDVYRYIAKLGNSHFDTEIMEKFVRHLSLYPNGTGVVLNTNHKGVVIGQNKLFPESPIVRFFKKDSNGIKKLYVDVDLSLTKYLYIKDTF